MLDPGLMAVNGAMAAIFVLGVLAAAGATPVAVHVRWRADSRPGMEVTLRVGRWRLAEVWPVPATPAAQTAPHALWDPRQIRGGQAALRFWAAFVAELAPRVRVTEWSLDVTVGLADAAVTAMATGALAVVVGTRTAALGRRLDCTPHWRVVPDWQAEHAGISGNASVGFEGRLGDLVGAVVGVAGLSLRRMVADLRGLLARRRHRGRGGTAH